MKLKRINSDRLRINPDAKVTNPEPFEKKTEWLDSSEKLVEVKKFSDDGIFSKRIFGDLQSKIEYSCSCGKYTGKFYADGKFVCPKCGTMVTEVIPNIDREGWIDLGDIYIIKYVAYMFLEKVFGTFKLGTAKSQKILDQIITCPNTIDLNGDLDVDAIQSMKMIVNKKDGSIKEAPEAKYFFIGLEELKKNYDEILRYYLILKEIKGNGGDYFSDEEIALVLNAERYLDDVTDEKDKANAICKIQKVKDFIKAKDSLNEYLSKILSEEEEKNAPEYKKNYDFLCNPTDVFTNTIPVISIVLRPAVRMADGIKEDEIDKEYGTILKNLKILNSRVDQLDLIRRLYIEQLQLDFLKLCDLAMENIKGKGGLIRNQICGTRVNFSARNIISPAVADIKTDEVILPYLTFLELYKFELTNEISKIKKVSLKRAAIIIDLAEASFNEEVYNIMKKIIKDHDIEILINRNPTIALGSILCLKVAGIKHDYNDMTMSIPNTILTLMNADYDGDVLNIISLKDTETKKVLKSIFSPQSMIIDSNNGRFNKSLNLERDQVLGINNLLS